METTNSNAPPAGHGRFLEINKTWPHRHECIRVSYAMDEAAVRDGLKIIAEEVRDLK